MSISIAVLGEPRAQGSKRAFALKKAGAYTGKVVMMESAGDGLKLWRQRLVEAVSQHAPDDGPWTGPVAVEITFFMPKPQKPKHHFPIGRVGDVDKLARAVLDTLSGVIIADDSQVVQLLAMKVYGAPGCDITISEVEWEVTV